MNTKHTAGLLQSKNKFAMRIAQERDIKERFSRIGYSVDLGDVNGGRAIGVIPSVQGLLQIGIKPSPSTVGKKLRHPNNYIYHRFHETQKTLSIMQALKDKLSLELYLPNWELSKSIRKKLLLKPELFDFDNQPKEYSYTPVWWVPLWQNPQHPSRLVSLKAFEDNPDSYLWGIRSLSETDWSGVEGGLGCGFCHNGNGSVLFVGLFN